MGQCCSGVSKSTPLLPHFSSKKHESKREISGCIPRRVGSSSFVQQWDGVPPDTLIFKGGGTKGVVYTGALKVLEEKGLMKNVRRIAGTSAGSQIAALVACGLSWQEMEEINRNSPWKDLLDIDHGCCGFVRNIRRLKSNYGLAKGEVLENFLDKTFEKATGIPKITFEQLYQATKKELRLGTCDMIKRKFEYLDRHTHPNMKVSLACRASSSIPIVFQPVKHVVPGHPDKLFVDGGLEGNLPITAFKGPPYDEDPSKRVLAFNLIRDEGLRSRSAPQDLVEFLSTAAEMLFEAAQGVHGVDTLSTTAKDLGGNVDIVNINTGDYGALDTDMGEEEIANLISFGQEAVTLYLEGKQITEQEAQVLAQSSTTVAEQPVPQPQSITTQAESAASLSSAADATTAAAPSSTPYNASSASASEIVAETVLQQGEELDVKENVSNAQEHRNSGHALVKAFTKGAQGLVTKVKDGVKDTATRGKEARGSDAGDGYKFGDLTRGLLAGVSAKPAAQEGSSENVPEADQDPAKDEEK